MTLEVLLVFGLLSLALASGFDHSHTSFAQFLDGAVSESGVDYVQLQQRRAKLEDYRQALASAPVTSFDHDQQLAFWINAYNANTLATILDNQPLDSIRQLDQGKVWSTRHFMVGGSSLTLDEMEHGRVRTLGDGRVHAAINCASKGCPPLGAAPLTPVGLDAQLDAAVQRWARTNAYTLQGDTLALSKVFEWFSGDFTSASQGPISGAEGNAGPALWFLSRYASPSDAARLTSGSLTVSWADYDWSLNQR